MFVTAYLQKLHTYLTKEHTETPKVALAVFAGIMIGTTPFYGFHLLICIGVSTLFQLNQIIVYAAANISNPFFATFINFASFELGYLMVNHRLSTLSIEEFQTHGWNLFWFWLLGSGVMGLSLGSLFGGSTYLFLKYWRTPSTDTFKLNFLKAVGAIERGFKDAGAGMFHSKFVAGKAKHDPVYLALLRMIPRDAAILDIGGGQGILTLLHAYMGRLTSNTKSLVMDWDEKKIAKGGAAAKQLKLNVSFVNADIHTYPLPDETFDCVCCIDVLHYNKPREQDLLLKRAANVVKPGGILMIRDMDASHPWRTRFTKLQESLSLKWGFSRADKLYPRTAASLTAALEPLGFDVDVKPNWQGTLFSNVLIVATKKNAAK